MAVAIDAKSSAQNPLVHREYLASLPDERRPDVHPERKVQWPKPDAASGFNAAYQTRALGGHAERTNPAESVVIVMRRGDGVCNRCQN